MAISRSSSLPADGNVIARELNDIFFLGEHGEEFTLRGWTCRNRFPITCAVDLRSQKPDEVIVKVDLITTGIFKFFVTDESAKADLKKTHVSYKDKTLDVKRTYTFKPDRVLIDDQLLWLHPETKIKTFYFTAAFCTPLELEALRLVNGADSHELLCARPLRANKCQKGLSFPLPQRISSRTVLKSVCGRRRRRSISPNRTCTFLNGPGSRTGFRCPALCIGSRGAGGQAGQGKP